MPLSADSQAFNHFGHLEKCRTPPLSIKPQIFLYGSWLNTVEIELSVYKRQCLNRRIPTIEQLVQETEMWNLDRNNSANKVDWQFSTKDARIKLKRLYPQV